MQRQIAARLLTIKFPFNYSCCEGQGQARSAGASENGLNPICSCCEHRILLLKGNPGLLHLNV